MPLRLSCDGLLRGALGTRAGLDVRSHHTPPESSRTAGALHRLLLIPLVRTVRVAATGYASPGHGSTNWKPLGVLSLRDMGWSYRALACLPCWLSRWAYAD